MNLTPTEQAEVARFGVHDQEVLEWMELHADDVVPCMRCDVEAHWRITHLCCRKHWCACHAHFLKWWRAVQEMDGRAASCKFCHGELVIGFTAFRVDEL